LEIARRDPILIARQDQACCLSISRHIDGATKRCGHAFSPLVVHDDFDWQVGDDSCVLVGVTSENDHSGANIRCQRRSALASQQCFTADRNKLLRRPEAP
jgi:hypothetical protein